MSQVKVETVLNGRKVEISAGWDRPCQEFFLNLFNFDPDAESEVDWSTLDEPGDDRTTDRIREVIRGFGISLPEGFWERVERREGNVIHVYTDSGWQVY